ncbi:MAG: peptidoglycan DD-metalloendopeptidase family protein [Oxalobacter sp.]|nr:peptidoglycan DD-metalloendopeptidase family protein [Oxalobacter sp.]
MKKTVYTLSILACAMLCACSSTQQSAPISDISGLTNPKQKQRIDADTVNYTVEPGDTLSQIARRSGHSVAELVAWNELSTPDIIEVGQVLRVQPPENQAVATPVDTGSGTPASTDTASRPVVPVSKPAIGKDVTYYTVESGDTLSGIARRSNHSVAELVSWNNLDSADSIEIGQKLRVQPTAATVAPVKKSTEKPAAEKAASTSTAQKSAATGGISEVRNINWSWPTQGKIVSSYTAAKRGIDIGGSKGQKVSAAADGTVLYKGTMTGYGNVVIIKHSSNVLSVYAHNNRMLVNEKQRVSRGQQIAEMGSTDSSRVKLHFEIRFQNKPVDPTKYLP